MNGMNEWNREKMKEEEVEVEEITLTGSVWQ